MWAFSRRTALFIVSYAPLAAMFLVLRWPAGWPPADLTKLGIWLVALALGFSLACAIPTLAGRRRRLAVGSTALLACVALVVIGIVKGWTAPLTLAPPKGTTSALVPAISFSACVVASALVVALLGNAQRAVHANWTVTDPRDQGSAAATYLATYLLPLLNPEGGGWRLTAAYGIYLLTLYVVFVRSDNLLVINPTLYIFGFRVFDVELLSEDAQYRRRVLLLMRGTIGRDTEVAVLPLGDNSYLAERA